MKRYWVFGGDCDYPSGGMCDFRGDYDSLEEAIKAARRMRVDWRQVFDSKRKAFTLQDTLDWEG